MQNLSFSKVLMLLSFVALSHTNLWAQGHDKARNRPSDVATDNKTKSKTEDKAQKDEDTSFNRWYFGGNVGFNFLNGGFAFNLSPLAGYRLTPKFSVGAGVIGVGISQSIGNYSAFYGQYGGRLFSRYDLFSGIFAHAELEQAYNTVPMGINNNKIEYQTTPLPAALAGLGLNFGTGPIRLNVTALYNFLYEGYSPAQQFSNQNNFNDYRFGALVLRAGVGFGF